MGKDSEDALITIEQIFNQTEHFSPLGLAGSWKFATLSFLHLCKQ